MSRRIHLHNLLIAILIAAISGAAVASSSRVTVRSVQAEFRQEKYLKILRSPICSSGRFLFQAPDSLRWEYTKPFRSVLLMYRGRIRKFVEHGGRLIEENGMPVDAMQMVLADIGNWLAGRFTDNDVFTVSRLGNTVRLVPKQEGMRAVISAIILELGSRPGLLDSVTIQEGGGGITRLVFSHARLNTPIDERLFRTP